MLHPLFEVGADVKLTDRYAATLIKHKQGSKHTKWSGRVGVVKSCNRSSVGVLWTGRVSIDNVPLGAVERCVKKEIV